MVEVVIFSTASLDGRITTKSGDSKLSCENDLKLLHKWRCWSDLVLVGANTAKTDDPSLFVKRVPCERQPLRGVVDGRLSVPHDLRLFKEWPWTTVVVTTFDGIRRNEWKFKYLKSLGVLFIVAGKGPEVDWGRALEELASRGVRKVLVEGGGRLNWSLLKYINTLEITYVGKVLGAGTSLFEGEGFDEVRESPDFEPSAAKFCECGRCIHITWTRNPYAPI